MSEAPDDCQAGRIFRKFGGVPALHRALARLPEPHHRGLPALYRWLYPRSNGGTGGIVPSSAQESVALAARVEGIFLTGEDWSPVRSR
jgi:hypothetical protein